VNIRVTLAALGIPVILAVLATRPGHSEEPQPAGAFPHFRMEEIETGLKVGYAVLLVDLNGDGKKDIVVVDTTRVVWYENPTWKRRTILQGHTRPDNVCIAAHDIDGDGQLDLALGADWKPFNTKSGGTLQWLKRGKTLDDPWTVYPIGDEPTVHRIRFADLDGTGKPALVVAPLMGQNSSGQNNWMDGAPVRILAYRIPHDPTRDRWVPEVVDQSLHVVHNFWPIPSATGKGMDLLAASYEGVSLLTHGAAGKWTRRQLGEGNQENLKSNRGASEIKQGTLKNGRKFIATIEPWHGHQVVVYTQPDDLKKLWDRHVIDDKLKWGHAVWCADLDGDGSDELIIGVRDDLSQKPTERRGVRIYKVLDERGAKWARHFVDPGGVAVEDMAVADLNNDGRIDLVAVGRQTGNVRIYWNEGARK
jgi:FG-GAP-like repeat